MANAKRVIIDCDPGIDDAAAILMALGSPELRVEALTTGSGNSDVGNCTLNALRILEAAGRADIPVFKGVNNTLTGHPPFLAPHIHGEDGLGDYGASAPGMAAQGRHAVYELISRVMASPGEVTVMSIGRQTNVALAMSIEPRFAAAAREIVVMGGAIYQPGNVSPVATANIWGDPEATDLVYRSGAKIAQIGLEIVNIFEISGEQQRRVWDAATPAAELMRAATRFHSDAYLRDGRLDSPDGVKYADVSPMAYVIAPRLFDMRDLYVRVETRGDFTRGQTVADLRKNSTETPNVRVAVSADGDAIAELWAERASRV